MRRAKVLLYQLHNQAVRSEYQVRHLTKTGAQNRDNRAFFFRPIKESVLRLLAVTGALPDLSVMAAGGHLSQASQHVFVKAQPKPWPSESAMEQLFRPLYKLGDRKISPFESRLRRECSQALTGKISSVRRMLKVLRENERARALRVLGIAVGLEPPPRYEIDQGGRRIVQWNRCGEGDASNSGPAQRRQRLCCFPTGPWV